MSSKKSFFVPFSFCNLQKMCRAFYRHQKMKWGFDLIRPNWDVFERRMWNILTITRGKETHHQKVCLFKKKVQRAFFQKTWILTMACDFFWNSASMHAKTKNNRRKKNHSLKLKDLKKAHYAFTSNWIRRVNSAPCCGVSAANKPEGGTSKRLLQIYVIDFKTTGLFRVYFWCCMPCESSTKRMGPITGSYYSLGSCGWQQKSCLMPVRLRLLLLCLKFQTWTEFITRGKNSRPFWYYIGKH